VDHPPLGRLDDPALLGQVHQFAQFRFGRERAL
jgi:hypothetical protein